jgi:hypothetical protein
MAETVVGRLCSTTASVHPEVLTQPTEGCQVIELTSDPRRHRC